jgi:hypothetical protein
MYHIMYSITKEFCQAHTLFSVRRISGVFSRDWTARGHYSAHTTCSVEPL